MDTAVFSVVYPGIEDYFTDFLDSLSKQTDTDFTLFLINDGLLNINYFSKRFDLDLKIKDATAPPTALRKMGINWVMETGAKKIIFADMDDYFAENRVEISRNILDNYDFVFNELILCGQDYNNTIRLLESHFDDGEVITCKRIMTSNCMGLSNTAIKAKSITRYIERIPEYIIAFDWALFALHLHDGAKGVFTNKTATHYRQHGNNLAALFSLEEEQILLGVQVKRDHYELLSRYYKEYVRLANHFKDLLVRLRSDSQLRKRYCRAVRKHSPRLPLWWESIKSLEEVGL